MQAFIFISLVVGVAGHGAMTTPASREVMWQQGYNSPADYDWMSSCGGGLQPDLFGKCGPCGDLGDVGGSGGPHNGGQFSTGQIVATYNTSELFEISVLLTADHAGYYEFFICDASDMDPSTPAPASCFQEMETIEHKCWEWMGEHPCSERPGAGTKNIVRAPLKPMKRAVLMWNWPTDNGGKEYFRSCADIKIVGDEIEEPEQPEEPEEPEVPDEGANEHEVATTGTCESHSNGRCSTAATVQECEAARDALSPRQEIISGVDSNVYPAGCINQGFMIYYNEPTTTTTGDCSDYECLCVCKNGAGQPEEPEEPEVPEEPEEPEVPAEPELCSDHWEQCGGTGWEGYTCCDAPYECKASGDWYSQCL